MCGLERGSGCRCRCRCRCSLGPAGAGRPDPIADRVVDAILAGRLAPGQRLGEQALADLFGVSRIRVREAMARLSARGMVDANARRGWFVVQPSLDEAREAFGARLALETGLLHGLTGPLPAAARPGSRHSRRASRHRRR